MNHKLVELLARLGHGVLLLSASVDSVLYFRPEMVDHYFSNAFDSMLTRCHRHFFICELLVSPNTV